MKQLCSSMWQWEKRIIIILVIYTAAKTYVFLLNCVFHNACMFCFNFSNDHMILSLLYNRHWVSSRVRWPGCGTDHPHPSTAEVKERVELWIFSPLGLHDLFQSEIYLYLQFYLLWSISKIFSTEFTKPTSSFIHLHSWSSVTPIIAHYFYQ